MGASSRKRHKGHSSKKTGIIGKISDLFTKVDTKSTGIIDIINSIKLPEIKIKTDNSIDKKSIAKIGAIAALLLFAKPILKMLKIKI